MSIAATVKKVLYQSHRPCILSGRPLPRLLLSSNSSLSPNHLHFSSTAFIMADNQEGEVKLFKDELTGEMVSKRCVSVVIRYDSDHDY